MLGAAAGVPTAGTAKSLLLARGVPPERAVRAAGGEALEWDVVGGEGEGGVVVARAVRAHPGVVAPVYASAGFRVGLDAAARVVRACCVHRRVVGGREGAGGVGGREAHPATEPRTGP